MASPPSTPPPELPRSCREWRFKSNDAPCEWAEQYRPGGLHPIDLGDSLCAGKYKVIRKLGAGSFATVWLAVREGVPRYVAIKIMTAKASIATTELAILKHLYAVAGNDLSSRHVTKLLDHFQHKGPNGTHECLAFEVMSTTAASLVEELPGNKPRKPFQPQRYPKWMAKKILLHTLRGLAFLHRNGVVHGDVHPGNLLFCIKDIDAFEPKQLEQDEAATARPLCRIDSKQDLWAPRNLYLKQSLHEYVQLDQDLCVKLSDFGAAFYATHPPVKTVTSLALRAPELILHQPFNSSIDIWSFGCLIFEFLTGEALFVVMMLGHNQEARDDADDEHLCQLNDTITRLPGSLMKSWPRASKWFDADHNRLQPDEDTDDDSNGVGIAASDGEGDEDDGKEPYAYDTLEQRFAAETHPDIDEEEADVICQLIRDILVYDPAERPSAEELLKHPWFAE